MASDNKIIAATVQVDTSKAQASVKGLNKDLKDVKAITDGIVESLQKTHGVMDSEIEETIRRVVNKKLN